MPGRWCPVSLSHASRSTRELAIRQQECDLKQRRLELDQRRVDQADRLEPKEEYHDLTPEEFEQWNIDTIGIPNLDANHVPEVKWTPPVRHPDDALSFKYPPAPPTTPREGERPREP